jgi:hypothetical protein
VIPFEQMTDEQFERHALDIIHRELGVCTVLLAFCASTGPERHQWLQGLTVQELAKEFEGRQV